MVLICTFLGLLYPVLSQEFDDSYAFINGGVGGFIGGILLALLEQNVGPKIIKTSFIKKLVIKTTVYTIFFIVLILGLVSFTRSIEAGQSYFQYLVGSQFNRIVFHEDFHIIILYTLFLCANIFIVRQLSRKMGQGILFHIITGTYHNPKEEERIFMCLDIKASTTIAEKLGDVKYNEFLNDFFYDITGSILLTKGEIYRYVGDEVVVSWNMKAGLQNAHCIRTFFLAKDEINGQKEKYFDKYGFVPGFRAAFHCGRVIRGEIGDVKSQLVFLGDVMYIVARVEKKCGELGHNILITSDLIQRISLPEILEMEYVGKLSASQKQKELDLYTLNEIELSPV